MKKADHWLQTHKFEAYGLAFLLMVLPAIPLTWAAQAGLAGGMLLCLGLILAGNLLAVAIR
jgi:hypothetical protein